MAEELSFYDVKTKKKFTSSDYRIEDRSGRKFAVTKSKEGSSRMLESGFKRFCCSKWW